MVTPAVLIACKSPSTSVFIPGMLVISPTVIVECAAPAIMLSSILEIIPRYIGAPAANGPTAEAGSAYIISPTFAENPRVLCCRHLDDVVRPVGAVARSSVALTYSTIKESELLGRYE